MDAMKKTGNTGYGTPKNREATRADLPHFRESSITEKPVGQEDSQHQRHWVQISPEEDPLQEVHTEASAEYLDEDDRPGYNPDNRAERSSLPTICTSYTNVHDANSKAEDFEHDRDATRPETVIKKSKEAESSDQDKPETTDDVSDDECIRPYAVAYRRDGETNGEPYAYAFDERDGTRPKTVIKQSNDTDSSDEKKAENTDDVSDDECIRPYAIAYRRDGVTNGEPYARAFYERDGTRPKTVIKQSNDADSSDEKKAENKAMSSDTRAAHNENNPVNNSQSVCGLPDTSSEPRETVAVDGLLPNAMYVGNALRPNPMYSGNALRPNLMYSGNALPPNPMYGGNALRPNPMYAPNVVQPRAAEYMTAHSSTHTPCDVQANCTDNLTPAPDANCTCDTGCARDGRVNGTGCSGKVNEDFEQTRIVFGGEGEEGQISGPSAVVVSPSSEIFVADNFNERVHVFNMEGDYLRHFPTILSGKQSETMKPTGISIDGKGICTDSSGNVLVANWDGGTVEMFTGDGRHVRRVASGMSSIDGVAVGPGGQLVPI
ncbi:TRIM2 [Branchiostoma lanceolatum]|uniref:TRIM2 protein n=1 Tax=Branchiostoma lanceolatum TaxID=7740 RepID=A0A8J9VAZ6_BRALA|nr:TRIM2 [Branchiostoma lanceolatum]